MPDDPQTKTRWMSGLALYGAQQGDRNSKVTDVKNHDIVDTLQAKTQLRKKKTKNKMEVKPLSLIMTNNG